MSIGRLIVEFEARTGKFETDTGRASKIMERRAREIDKQVSRIATAAAAAFTATAGAVAVLVKNSIDSADELSKLSQKIGIATDELSKLNYAADLAGVETASLQTALQRLSRSAVDTAEGTGESKDAFEALGVSVTDTEGRLKSTDALLLELADAFAKFEDGPAKTAAAMDIFGKAGADLIPLLNGGASAIRSAGVELQKLGGVITPEAGRQAEQFNDNLSRLQKSISGVGNQISQNLLGTLVDLSDELVGTAVEGDKVKTVADEITKAVQAMAIGVAVAGESIAVVARAVRAFVGSFQAVAADIRVAAEIARRASPLGLLIGEEQNLEQLLADRNRTVQQANERYVSLWNDNATSVSDALRRSFNAQKGFVDQTQALIDNATGLGQSGIPFRPGMGQDEQAIPFRPGKGPEKSQLNFKEETDKTTASVKAQKSAVDEWAASLESARAISDEVTRIEEARNRVLYEGRALTESLRSPIEEYESGIVRLNELLAAGAITQETYNRAVFGLQDAFNQATTGFEKIGQSAGDTGLTLTAFADQAARNMQDAFADFLFNPFEDGLRGMVRSFAQALQRMAAEALAANIFGALTGGGGGGGLLGSIISALPGLGGGAPISPMPRALGGPVSPESLYMVGERGPELFVPKTAGTIVPNEAMGKSQQSIRIVNAFDTSVISDYMSSAAGEQTFTNLLSRNGARIRAITAGAE